MTGKKYIESAKLIEKAKLYDAEEAIGLVCQTAKAKFDETVELHVRLGVDSRHADQQVRGAIVLPNGTGKTVRTLYLQRVTRLTLLPLQALTTLVLKIWFRRSQLRTGSTSTLLSLLPI